MNTVAVQLRLDWSTAPAPVTDVAAAAVRAAAAALAADGSAMDRLSALAALRQVVELEIAAVEAPARAEAQASVAAYWAARQAPVVDAPVPVAVSGRRGWLRRGAR